MSHPYNLRRQSRYRGVLPPPTKRSYASVSRVKTGDESGDAFQRHGIPGDIIDDIFAMSGIGGMARLISKTYKSRFDHVRKINVSQYLPNYKMVAGGVLRDLYNNPKLYEMAIKFDSLDVVKKDFKHKAFAGTKSNINQYKLIEIACVSGSLKVLEWALSSKITTRGILAHDICSHATIAAGRLDVLKWAHAHALLFDHYEVMEIAAKEGQVAILEWLVSIGYIWDYLFKTCTRMEKSYPLRVAIVHGQVQVVKFMIEKHKVHVSERIRLIGRRARDYCNAAAERGGNLEIMMLLRENGFPWGPGTIDLAMASGNAPLVRWCRANGCPMHDDLVVARWMLLNEL